MNDLKKKSCWSDISIWLGSSVIATIFILSGITKAYEPEIFVANAEKYRIVDGMMLLFIGAWLPWIEGGLGILTLASLVLIALDTRRSRRKSDIKHYSLYFLIVLALVCSSYVVVSS